MKRDLCSSLEQFSAVLELFKKQNTLNKTCTQQRHCKTVPPHLFRLANYNLRISVWVFPSKTAEKIITEAAKTKTKTTNVSVVFVLRTKAVNKTNFEPRRSGFLTFRLFHRIWTCKPAAKTLQCCQVCGVLLTQRVTLSYSVSRANNCHFAQQVVAVCLFCNNIVFFNHSCAFPLKYQLFLSPRF